MAYARRSFSGYAVNTTLASAVGASDTTLSIVASTGWPDGSTGKFYVRIDPGLSTEEKVLVTTRSGTTLQTVARGKDGTAASAHSAGATVECCFAAVDLDEANYWVAELSGAATTAGDLPVADAANSLTKIAKGSNSTVFGVDANSTLGYATLTSAQITDDTLVNADFNSSAGIALSKLETISTGYVVGNNSGASAAPSAISIASWTTVRKAADESVTSSTTLQDDNELYFTTTAGAIYLIEFALVYASPVGGSAPSLKFASGESSAFSGYVGSDFYIANSGTNAPWPNLVGGGFPNFNAAGTATTKRVLSGWGPWIGEGSTFKIQWSQYTSDANAVTVYAGSYLRYKLIAT